MDFSTGKEYLKRLENIADWIAQIERCSSEETCPATFVPSTQFIYVREEDNKIIGVLQIRHYCNEYLRKYSGHIGYPVKVEELLYSAIAGAETTVDLSTAYIDPAESASVVKLTDACEKANNIVKETITFKNDQTHQVRRS